MVRIYLIVEQKLHSIDLLSFFPHENKFVFYQDVRELRIKMGLSKYFPIDLFIDSSERSLKSAPLPITPSIKMKE